MSVSLSRPPGSAGRPGEDRKRVTVVFDQGTVDQIEKLAARDRCSVGEAVRTLVEWGLESASMADAGNAGAVVRNSPSGRWIPFLNRPWTFGTAAGPFYHFVVRDSMGAPVAHLATARADAEGGFLDVEAMAMAPTMAAILHRLRFARLGSLANAVPERDAAALRDLWDMQRDAGKVLDEFGMDRPDAFQETGP